MSRIERPLRDQARANHRKMNYAETRLWHIRRRQFDVRFRRQHPAYGRTVLRFWSWDIYRDNEAVLTTIGATIDKLRSRSAALGN